MGMKLPIPEELKDALTESLDLMRGMDNGMGAMGEKLDRIADLLERLVLAQGY